MYIIYVVLFLLLQFHIVFLIFLQNGGMAPIVTHNMVDDHLDPVLNCVRKIQMFNLKTDRVKVLNLFYLK